MFTYFIIKESKNDEIDAMDIWWISICVNMAGIDL